MARRRWFGMGAFAATIAVAAGVVMPMPLATAEDAPAAAEDAPAAAEAAPATVQCYGDSILASVCGGASSALQQAIPASRVQSYAQGGHSSGSIATKIGAYVLRLSSPVTIPGSGSVSVGRPAWLPSPDHAFGPLYMQASIAGVGGWLFHDPSQGIAWRFDRTVGGAPVDAPAGTAIQSLEVPQPGTASIIWAGTNNLLDVSQVLADVDAMVRHHQATSGGPFWVVSVTPAWGNSGSIYGQARSRINATLQARYASYVPLDLYLANGAITDAGLVPTARDREWIAAGANPPAFWAADWVHFNSVGQQRIAAFLARFVAGGLTAAQAVAEMAPQASMSATASGLTATVRGWAFDRSDLYAPLAMGVTVDGRWMGTTLANRASPELGRYGVPGGHGFSMAVAIPAGTSTVCVVAVGIGAGGDHVPPCVQVTGVAPAPQGDMTVVPVGGTTVAVMGWAFDHADLYAQIPVGIIIDGRWHVGLTAALPSDYLRPYGVPGAHAFFAGATLSPGTHTACAVAVSPRTGLRTTIGCQTFTIRG
ncbi:SGNH/GDSL hydrolase family protein [Agrococcus jejuensis]|uniref:SGNH/GDSL hydrolase family protein n=1 Tax=Agrococcus jejuensis TaxID=399736 RepID=UPI0011A72A2A|nr:SGNH/GDSL hydrolase family protein [Agrococcus jejuensis]